MVRSFEYGADVGPGRSDFRRRFVGLDSMHTFAYITVFII